MSPEIQINRTTDCLFVVDVQNDFCPGGSLAVTDGDQIIPIINELQKHFTLSVFTRDWHPQDHNSFADEPQFIDKSWPVHCVAGTPGAAFHEKLNLPGNALIIDKGTNRELEAYSGFQGTDLTELLTQKGVNRLFICGLATDYCVKASALDGVAAGFSVFCVVDATRGVDIPPGSVQIALWEMEQAGVVIIEANQLTSKE